MTTLSPVARAMRASARGSRPSVFGVGSTTVPPPARLNNRISSWATRSSRSRRLSRLALKFWRTHPRFARLTGSHARPLSLAPAGSANITLKSIRRCSCGSVTPIASGATAPSTVWICPWNGRGMRASQFIDHSTLVLKSCSSADQCPPRACVATPRFGDDLKWHASFSALAVEPGASGHRRAWTTRAGGPSSRTSSGPERPSYRNAGAISAMNRSRSRRSSSSGRNMLGMNSVSTRADWS